jgi:chemotaxis protein MotB
LPSGCFAPRSQLTEAKTENRVFADQNKAQLVEIESLKSQLHAMESKTARAEEDLAIACQQYDLDRRQLAKYEKEHAELVEQYQQLARNAQTSPSLGKQLQDLSSRYQALHYDPKTGLSKLDSDILFDRGNVELNDDARQMLSEFAQVLKSRETNNLKIMVVGHTDKRAGNREPMDEPRDDHFQVSSARAVAVANFLRAEGIGEERIGVAGLGSSQPIASNASPYERQRNRRVEIFLVPPDTPVVGWTDTTPTVYR